MKQRVRKRIEHLEAASKRRAGPAHMSSAELRGIIRDVALPGVENFCVNLRAHFEANRNPLAVEDIASIGIDIYEEANPGSLDFRHAVYAFLGEMGIRDPVTDPFCWCPDCFRTWSARSR